MAIHVRLVGSWVGNLLASIFPGAINRLGHQLCSAPGHHHPDATVLSHPSTQTLAPGHHSLTAPNEVAYSARA
jgi:hypothetical protein